MQARVKGIHACRIRQEVNTATTCARTLESSKIKSSTIKTQKTDLKDRNASP